MSDPKPRKNARVWLVTGCSSGLGRALAEAVLAGGEYLVATARAMDRLADLVSAHPDRALALALDVTCPEQVRFVVEHAINWRGHVDVLVNNAGYGLVGAIEEVEESEAWRIFETNVFGPLRMMRAVLPHMPAQMSGNIVNISSMAGFVGAAGIGIYSATKFALEGLSEALAKEVASLGIQVTIVEPGSFRTDWAGRSLVMARETIVDYLYTVGSLRDYIKVASGKQPGDPSKAAAAILEAIEADPVPQRLVLGRDALSRVRAKLDAMAAELAVWEKTTIATGFEADAG